MSNDKQVSRPETATPAAHAQALVREGVLAVPGELKLHFGGTLEGRFAGVAPYRLCRRPCRGRAGRYFGVTARLAGG